MPSCNRLLPTELVIIAICFFVHCFIHSSIHPFIRLFIYFARLLLGNTFASQLNEREFFNTARGVINHSVDRNSSISHKLKHQSIYLSICLFIYLFTKVNDSEKSFVQESMELLSIPSASRENSRSAAKLLSTEPFVEDGNQEEESFTTKELFSFAWQIAKGMVAIR